MEKKQFQAESKRLMDLMINSIYTHKEIFLREIISNASDAMDKLAYLALTDDSITVKSSDFTITVTPDKEHRTLTVTDNGIGMTQEDLENNLGTIARSGSLQFKQEMGKDNAADIIGQFGVGFYSAFMVAQQVTVITRRYGADQAYRWESSGVDGYTITPCEMDGWGTQVIMTMKDNTEEENYDEYLDTNHLQSLIKKYSDYIRHPIRMVVEDYRMKEKPADAPEDYKPEWETVQEEKTINSMVPLWQRPRSKVEQEEYDRFYQEKFMDWQAPLATITTSSEGTVTYKALLFIPGQTPFDFYTREYEKGLQLYSSGVLIMDKCADLLPDCFRFVKGVVDSPDFSLNISREMLQHTRQLKIIATALEKKIKNELAKLMKDDWETYEKFWAAFGRQLKYSVVDQYGSKKDLLRDLLLFPSTASDKLTSLAEYVERMKEDQEFIYYVCADSTDQAAHLPQVERVTDRGYEILCLTEEVDEFVMQALAEVDGKKIKSVSAPDALPETDEEKAQQEKQAEESKSVLDFVKETLGDKIKEARISKILKTAPVCMTADGPMTLEMEKYFSRMEGAQAGMMKAERVLELNPNSTAFAALRAAVDSGDKDKAATYVQVLYHQALLIAGLPIEDAAAYTELVCSLMQ
ncbi:molecular chaperone HtpG [Pseudoflavonifractor capillosus]|uniref:molecular chaperone HtpG n=1 Tax=Pseudoflavonifractor capillosus TaxID=106588 RepID=UPI00195D7D2D|nr:molecular chaperone HtpG [Pseudoflavonifractor capillosus]MBM6897668.1 molecular chaperone HtpG [Pseudoflavonifractor capillosus]